MQALDSKKIGKMNLSLSYLSQDQKKKTPLEEKKIGYLPTCNFPLFPKQKKHLGKNNNKLEQGAT